MLWSSIVSNKLLERTDIILFLNKCDILDHKLKSGIRLAKYVRSYQDRPNDADTAQKCMPRSNFFMRNGSSDRSTFCLDFRAKFSAILREYSPNPRKFYGFCTSVTVSP